MAYIVDMLAFTPCFSNMKFSQFCADNDDVKNLLAIALKSFSKPGYLVQGFIFDSRARSSKHPTCKKLTLCFSVCQFSNNNSVRQSCNGKSRSLLCQPKGVKKATRPKTLSNKSKFPRKAIGEKLPRQPARLITRIVS